MSIVGRKSREPGHADPCDTYDHRPLRGFDKHFSTGWRTKLFLRAGGGADERAICRSPSLSAADARLALLYRDIQHCTMMGGRGDNIDDQREWLTRRGQCGGNSACLARIYRARNAHFTPMAARARKLMRSEECPGPLR